MIRGPSGGGKTTLLNMLGTIDMATSGVISNYYIKFLFNCIKKIK